MANQIITHNSPIYAIAAIDKVIKEKRIYLNKLDQSKYEKVISIEHSVFNRIEIAVSTFKKMNFIENWYEIDLYLQTLISSGNTDICDITIPIKAKPNFGKKVRISLNSIPEING